MSSTFCRRCGAPTEPDDPFCSACGAATGTSADAENELVDGKYRLAERLGEGGMGEVFRAVHVMTGQAVARRVAADPDASVAPDRSCPCEWRVDAEWRGKAIPSGDLTGPEIVYVHFLRAKGKDVSIESKRGELTAALAFDVPARARNFYLLTLARSVFEQTGDTRNAEHLYQLAQQTDPSDYRPHGRLAWLHRTADGARDLDRAEQEASQALRLAGGEDPGVFDTLAEVACRRGDGAGALERLRQARALDPDEDYYQERLSDLRAGRLDGCRI